MTTPGALREEQEKLFVGPYGVLASASKGRAVYEEPCPLRTCFRRDVDRIVHSKSFRRLKHKTQVFLDPVGDHYRTRMTHTLELSMIARTIARALALNEDLTEAISLGHDLGHTPFGHAGERALASLMDGGFKHYEQSLRVVDILEKDGKGLNLCYETRMGILNHTHGTPEDSCEATVVRLSDHIAYMNHDLDDAIRAGILSENDIPEYIRTGLGERNSLRINSMVADIIENSGNGVISFSEPMQELYNNFHDYMFETVYRNPVAKAEEKKVDGIISGIFNYYLDNPSKLPEEFTSIAEKDGLKRAICDYIAGMTDGYAMEQYSNIYIPMAWTVK